MESPAGVTARCSMTPAGGLATPDLYRYMSTQFISYLPVGMPIGAYVPTFEPTTPTLVFVHPTHTLVRLSRVAGSIGALPAAHLPSTSTMALVLW